MALQAVAFMTPWAEQTWLTAVCGIGVHAQGRAGSDACSYS